MDDIARAIESAWKRVLPSLIENPDELRRRLDRRADALLNRPPRAWCVAVRASDTRLAPYCRTLQARDAKHDVVLDAAALARLTAHIHVARPGEALRDLAKRLGVRPHSLLDARLNGLFHTHYVRGLGGRGGKPTPILYTPLALDPCTRGFVSNDAP